MGRRSNFKRIDKDAYDTFDRKAYPPLLRQLTRPVKFWEPCGGKYDMAEALEEAGHDCVIASDIAPRDERVFRVDAMDVTAEDVDCTGVEYIITNPVWSRPLMHRMIWNFSGFRPTWVLFDAAWAHTTQEVPARKYGVPTAPELMEHCHMIVSVGRLQWIEGTNQRGVDDCCWYLFDRTRERLTAYPLFVGPEIAPRRAA